MTHPYNSYSEYLISKYGCRIYRVGIDAGFSCPNRHGENRTGGCVYCDNQAAAAAYLRTSESNYTHDSGFEEKINNELKVNCPNIRQQIERGRNFIKRRYKTDRFAVYFQSYSNTFAPVERLKSIYDSVFDSYEWEGFIVSTRPDCVDEKKLELLESYRERTGNVCIELGLQSGCDAILEAMNRGHSVKCLVESALAAKRHGLDVCLHVLTGFPGEGQKELDQTIEAINKVKPFSIKIHNLNIAAGTALYEDYLQGEVTSPCSLRHIANSVYILRRIPQEVVIERLIAETPSHRLASPRLFPDKNRYIKMLDDYMNKNCFRQGDLYK